MHRISRLFVTGATWFRAHRTALAGYFAITAVITCAVLLPLHFGIAASDTDTSAFGMPSQEDVINLIAKIFNGLAGVIGKLILGLIGIILIPILNYDGFATSSIVGLGWSLVRDTVNMFVVVSLLVIAILTIVGSPKVNWQQQIPRLFIYVVLVNFSRTICGFLIDIGNVIMFQFVNALVEIGAGNFSNLLKLSIVGDISEGVDTVTALQNMGAGFLQVSLMLMIFAIVGIIAIVFIYRIVVLWVLIIMSPAAFFLGGVKDIFAQAGSAYGEWWKKFSSAIIIGPILSFFLWLALAASASGDIVTRENFPIGDTENFGIVLKIFDMSQLTGLLLGVILLVVGLQRAASAAGTLGFVAARLVTEDMGFKIAKAGLKWPSTFGRGAYKVAETVAPETTARASAGALKFGGELVSYGGSAMGDVAGKVPVVGGIGTWAMRKVSEQGNKMYAAGGHMDEEQTKKAKESLKHVPDSYKKEALKAMATGGGTFSGMSKWQQEVMWQELATKTGAQKQAQATFKVKEKEVPEGATEEQRKNIEKFNRDNKAAADKKFDDLMKKVIHKAQHDLDAGHSDFDETEKTAFNATKSQYIDLLFDDGVLAEGAKSKEKAIKFIADPDSKFDPRVARKEAFKYTKEKRGKLVAMRNAYNSRVDSFTKDGKAITYLHLAESGKYGTGTADTIRASNGLMESDGIPLYRMKDDNGGSVEEFGIHAKDPRKRKGGGDSEEGTPTPKAPPTPTFPVGGGDSSGSGAGGDDSDNDEPPTPSGGGGGGGRGPRGGGGGAPAPAGGGGAAPVGGGAGAPSGQATNTTGGRTVATALPYSARAARAAVARGARTPVRNRTATTTTSSPVAAGSSGRTVIDMQEDSDGSYSAPGTARPRETVTPIASADAALEERQAAANNNNAWEDSDSGSDTGNAA